MPTVCSDRKFSSSFRRNDPDRYLHLLAFIAHQYYRLQDNLIDALLASLRSFHNSAIRAHKEQCYARRELRNESLKALLGGLERGLVGTLTTIGITKSWSRNRSGFRIG